MAKETNRLNGLTLLNIHSEINVKSEDIGDLFAKQISRRLQSCLQVLFITTYTFF